MIVYLFVSKLMKTMEYDELPDMGDILTTNDKYNIYLYAFTKKKRLKKLFEKSRNMQLFKIIEKDMSDEEYEMFVDEYSDAELIEDYLNSKTHKHNTVNVVITKRESDTITCTPEMIIDTMVYEPPYKINSLPIKKKINRAMTILGIPQIESILYGDDNNPEWLHDSGLELDELELFVNEYYETIKN